MIIFFWKLISVVALKKGFIIYIYICGQQKVKLIDHCIIIYLRRTIILNDYPCLSENSG